MKSTIETIKKLNNLENLREAQRRELLWIIVPAVAIVALGFWLASRFVEPAPPKTLAISTASETGGYFANAKKYAAILKRSGVTLDVKTSAGSGENVTRLLDPRSGVHVALLQGGTTNAEQSPGLVSIGRVYLEPMWVFYRGEKAVDRLAQLVGKRIIVGAEGSGTRKLALELLKPNNISEANTTFLPLQGAAAIAAISKGDADVAFFTSGANSPQIQQLIRTPGLRLMSFSQAEAYTRLFPYLSKITLPKGAFDLVNNVPEQDIDMVAPVAALVAREDVHPALIGLLAEAAKEVHASGGMFNRIGEFPKAQDPEFDMADEAVRIYASGPPFLRRYLPFWLATFIERMKVMALPIATLLIPLVKLGPALFRWRIRQRILYWYGQLKALERRVAFDSARADAAGHSAELTRIYNGIEEIHVPLAFSEQYYSLRAAADIVRQRVAALA